MISEQLSHAPDWSEDTSAWHETLNDDDRVVVHTPPGYWLDLVLISKIKRLLQDPTPLDYRVKFLNWLERQPHGILNIEAIKAVEPACDTAMAMLDETKGLSVEAQCRVFRDLKLFAKFIQLNPSLLRAMHLMNPERALSSGTFSNFGGET